MSDRSVHVVTGAYGYSGRYIAQRLLDRGRRVKTLTNSLRRENPFGDAVKAEPFSFDNPARLTASLSDAVVLYNTYWVRFSTAALTQADAVRNTLTLFRCAREAGVERIVHISITNPAEDSPLEYFRHKAVLESELRQLGISYAILRPALLFGGEDILVNNIAWVLRHAPCFGIFGDGSYRLRPIHVEDLAALAVEQGESRQDAVIDAVGPETFTFRELVRTIGEIIGKPKPAIGMPRCLAYLAARATGVLLGDVMLTREEVKGLMAGKLYTDSPSAGQTRLSEWAKAHVEELGRRYASEMARRRDRVRAYGKL